MTSTMKSEPGRSAVSTSTFDMGPGSGSFARIGAEPLRGASACWAPAGLWAATKAAAPPAAPFKKLRRPTESFLDFAMISPPLLWCIILQTVTIHKQVERTRHVLPTLRFDFWGLYRNSSRDTILRLRQSTLLIC